MSSEPFLEEEEDLGRIYDRRMIRRLWHYVAPYRGQVIATLLLVVPMFALEAAPAWIIKTGLDRVLGDGASAVGPDWLQALLDGPGAVPPLAWLAGLYLLVMVSSAALQFLHLLLMSTTGYSAMRDLRRDTFAHLQHLHLGFFDRYPVGRLVTRATNDVENVAEMFSAGIVALVTDVLKMLGFATILFLVDWRLAAMAFLVVPLLAACAVVFRWRMREAFRRVRVRIARINATIQESVTGMKVVQLFTREARNLRDFDAMNASHRDAWLQSIRYDAALFAVVEIAGGITVAIIVAYGWGIATAGVLYVFIDWMRRFFMPLRDLSAKFSVLQSAMASSERIFQLLDTAPAIADRADATPSCALSAPRRPANADDAPEAARASAAGSPGGARSEPQASEVHQAASEPAPRRYAGTPASAAGSPGGARSEPQASEVSKVSFENVWFAYQGEDWILRDLSFRVAPGERVALVGATGAGKTTVIKLLTRLYEVTRGRILLDGVDLRELPQRELRRRVAMVLQDVFLFSGTVASNIGLERADIGAGQIERAARAVEAHRFIERLPQGYDTVLRERGSDLSAGQRQLLSFARALAHRPDVLVLDEATSSVDPETELLLQQGIHTLMEQRTAIVVAHRLSTIQDVDRIHVLHRGHLVESGRHDELIAHGGVYHRLYRLQFELGQESAGPHAVV
ncbi:MAG: ABC transporter transmembrane domain-containing protein [Myxococcota bacterium]|nr:ABC transporter transmembrane domain-containing protein [Myxococcota bacterium]